jgi:phospholipid/cholesterol/gamma-HCH transport system substrate-binding protein
MPSPRQIAWARIRVFAVTVAAAAVMAVLVYLLSGGSVLFEAKSTLIIYVPDATGLAAGAVVRVNGIDVGKVRAVSLSGSNQPNRVVRVALTIERQYLPDIPTDSYAQTEADTAIGDKYINITRGRNAASVQSDAEIPFRPQPDLMKSLDIEQFTQQIRKVDALLDDIEQGRNPTGQFLLSDQVYNQIQGVIGSFEKQVRSIQSPRNPVGKMLYTDEDYRRIREPLAQIDQAIAAIQNGQNPLGKLLLEDTQYNQLAAQLTQLRASIQTLRNNDFFTSDEMYKNWNRGLTSLIQGVDQFNISPLLSSSEMYDNLNGLAAQFRDNLHEFRQDPQKFLRIKLF